jgi:hypothetical protein
MIGFVERALQRIGLLPKFDKDDVLNATIEDKVREHESVVDRLHHTMNKRLETNALLRKSIAIAKQRTNSFEAFERLALRRENRQ